jgi:hypothetical protein
VPDPLAPHLLEVLPYPRDTNPKEAVDRTPAQALRRDPRRRHDPDLVRAVLPIRDEGGSSRYFGRRERGLSGGDRGAA